MEDITNFYMNEMLEQIRQKEQIWEVIEKLLDEHELIFSEISNNDIDHKIVKAVEDQAEFLSLIKKSNTSFRSFDNIVYYIRDVIAYKEIYTILDNIKPLQIPFEELGLKGAVGNLVYRDIQKIQQEYNLEQEDIIVHAYMYAVRDFKARVTRVIDEQWSVKTNQSFISLLMKYRKLERGNKWKIIKSTILKDDYIKSAYKKFKTSYLNELKLKKYFEK